MTVRHPLVRSAVYQAATGDERRDVHRALADVLDGLEDADRATWHRAAAAEGPDQEIGSLLDEVGSVPSDRGAYRAAADAHDRSAELTVDPHARAGRRLAAARNAWAAGQATRASALLSAAREQADDDPLLLADVDRLRARIEFNVGSAVRRAPDPHPGRAPGLRPRPGPRPRDGRGGRRGPQPRRRQRSHPAARHHRRTGLLARHRPHPVPQAAPRQHPARHRRRPGRGPRGALQRDPPGRGRRTGLRWAGHGPRPAREPRQRGPPPGRRRRAPTLLRPDAVDGPGEQRRHGRPVRPPATHVRAVRLRPVGSPAQRHGGSRRTCTRRRPARA